MNIVNRRVSAFLLDMLLIVSLTVMMCQLGYANPYKNKYETATEEYNQVVDEMYATMTESGSIPDYKDLAEVIIPVSYKLEKYSSFLYIWYLVFAFLYLVVFQYFVGGQTLGKKLFKIKVVNKDESDAKFYQYLLRFMLIGSSLIIGVHIFVIAKLIIALTANANVYYISDVIIKLISFTLEVALLITCIAKKGNYSINDYIAKTKVINLN